MSDELIHKSEMQKWIESKARKPKMSDDLDLISRQAAIEAIRAEREWLDENTKNTQHYYHMVNETARILFLIGELPSIQSKEKTGKWFGTVCSACGESTSFYYDCFYCPNCGAKMEDNENE